MERKQAGVGGGVPGLLDQVKADTSQVNFEVGRAFSEKEQGMEPGTQQFLVSMYSLMCHRSVGAILTTIP